MQRLSINDIETSRNFWEKSISDNEVNFSYFFLQHLLSHVL